MVRTFRLRSKYQTEIILPKQAAYSEGKEPINHKQIYDIRQNMHYILEQHRYFIRAFLTGLLLQEIMLMTENICRLTDLVTDFTKACLYYKMLIK
jgi:hypothetical protein